MPEIKEFNKDTIVTEVFGNTITTYRVFRLKYCYRSYADWYNKCQGGTKTEVEDNINKVWIPCTLDGTEDRDYWPTVSDQYYNKSSSP
jgi:hypothetical protein